MPVFQALGTSTLDFPVKELPIMVLPMSDDNEPDPKIQKSGAGSFPPRQALVGVVRSADAVKKRSATGTSSAIRLPKPRRSNV
jgi:hypothetical protein